MRTSEALDTEYENGVADVLAFLADDRAVVERNVKLPGRRSRTDRQVDVLIRGRLFGATDAVAIVDCKRWAKRVDVADVGAFLDLVEDVGAEVGLLISTRGGSPAAHRRAKEARGLRLQVMSLDELEQWAPPGTFSCEYRIPAHKLTAASHALRRAGFRVAPSMQQPPTDAEAIINVFQHYGTRSPTSKQTTDHWDRASATMAKVGITTPVLVKHGITVSGGTPAHRWLDAALDGQPIGLKILAATPDEAEQELQAVRELVGRHGLPADRVSYIKPDDWPVEGLFAAWPA